MEYKAVVGKLVNLSLDDNNITINNITIIINIVNIITEKVCICYC